MGPLQQGLLTDRRSEPQQLWAQRGAFSLTCRVEVNILADAARVWDLLTDA